MSDDPRTAVDEAEDLTGERRMAWNVLASWGGHLVFVVAGFVMPRVIDRHIGQVSLGIWDFSWSLVSYFGLAGLGVGSSVNRNVARHRATGDLAALNRTVSSVMTVQLVIAATVLLLAAAAAWTLPVFFAGRLGGLAGEARWVVALLGASLAVQMAFDTSRGVMTGCHRWDLHNAVNAGSYGLTVVGMVVALSAGAALRGISCVYLAVTVITELWRWVLARRVCPGLSRGLGQASWTEARSMLSFGIKTIVAGLPPLILFQGTSLLVGRVLGPAALAVLARPCNLLRSVQTFTNKFAFVLTPMAGSLQGTGREGEVRDLMIRATRFTAFLVLPITAFVLVLGDMLLLLWMGPRYAAGRVLSILALGYLMPMLQQPAMTVLIGLDMHGRVAVQNLVVTLLGFGAGVLLLGARGWSLEGAALAIAVPFAAGSGIAVALLACRRLGIPLREYLLRAYGTPLLCCIPFAACLIAVRIVTAEPWAALAGGAVAGSLVLAPLYWFVALPERARAGIRARVARGWEIATSQLGGSAK